jgi:hypothetical protein
MFSFDPELFTDSEIISAELNRLVTEEVAAAVGRNMPKLFIRIFPNLCNRHKVIDALCTRMETPLVRGIRAI